MAASAVRSLSVVLPAFNEADNLERVVASCTAYLTARFEDSEVLVVDDGSADDTWAILERLAAAEPRLRPLRHPANRGYGAALRTGFAAATRPFVFYMDADGQFDIADLDHLLPLATDERHIVTGFRARRRDPLVRRLNARLFGALVRILLDVRVRDLNCAFKLIPRAVLEQVSLESTGALINAELFARARRQGFGIKEVAVAHYPRTAGAQTGARPAVILRAFAELFRLRRRIVATAPGTSRAGRDASR